MKVYKITMVIVDHDDLGKTGLLDEIENVRWPNDCISGLHIVSITERDIGEWDDGHPLNGSDDARQAEVARLFGSS